MQGGGVNNAGDLTLLRDTVAFNTVSDPPSGHTLATGDGGGILSTGSLVVQDSTVASNRATGSATAAGVILQLTASGTLAFRSQPITLSATARANRHTLAATRSTALRPGHATLVLIPTRRAARIVHSAHVAAITVIITIRGGAGRQIRRLTIRLTR